MFLNQVKRPCCISDTPSLPAFYRPNVHVPLAKAKDLTSKAKAKTNDTNLCLKEPRSQGNVLEDSNTVYYASMLFRDNFSRFILWLHYFSDQLHGFLSICRQCWFERRATGWSSSVGVWKIFSLTFLYNASSVSSSPAQKNYKINWNQHTLTQYVGDYVIWRLSACKQNDYVKQLQLDIKETSLSEIDFIFHSSVSVFLQL